MSGMLLFSGHHHDEPAEGAAAKVFGEAYRGRYHLPLLPGESGTKSGGNWVPYGVMSATNLAGAMVDSRALSVWLIERGMIGLARRPELFEKLVFATNVIDFDPTVDIDNLKDTEVGRGYVKLLAELHDLAKTAAGGNRAAAHGTNRHDVWEARALTGVLFGTPQINAEIVALEKLLEENGLERVAGLQERVVRNTALNAAGKFDDIVRSTKTGKLYLADLKTKRKAFYSWTESWIQSAVYATADYMLDDARTGYVPGPVHHVDQKSSVLLRMPSDGAPPYLERVDLEIGARWARLARDVVDARAEGKAKKTFELARWSETE